MVSRADPAGKKSEPTGSARLRVGVRVDHVRELWRPDHQEVRDRPGGQMRAPGSTRLRVACFEPLTVRELARKAARSGAKVVVRAARLLRLHGRAQARLLAGSGSV